LIVNPNSGKKEGRALSERVAAHLGEHFPNVDVRLSSCAADVEVWAREAREREYDALFVMGGDGTVGLSFRGL
ncbi:acylglycerol kinase family protein, partial [Barnesiella sp. GGCC_0306]|nr:acylglycerol kinase family protein [Barnesiella sp. GGCC_0306]